MSYGKESGGERRRGLRRTAEPECQKRKDYRDWYLLWLRGKGEGWLVEGMRRA